MHTLRSEARNSNLTRSGPEVCPPAGVSASATATRRWPASRLRRGLRHAQAECLADQDKYVCEVDRAPSALAAVGLAANTFTAFNDPHSLQGPGSLGESRLIPHLSAGFRRPRSEGPQAWSR